MAVRTKRRKTAGRAPRKGATARKTRPASRVQARKVRNAGSAAAGNAPNGRPVATGIGLNFHHMDYTTHDLEGMKRFFVETLGFTNVMHVPEHNYLTVFVTPQSSLGFMPPASGAPDQWRPPGEPAFYFFVDDVDRTYRELSGRGVAFERSPQDMPWGHRLAILRDPEGRAVCLAQRRRA